MQGFEETAFSDNFFDVVIGNVPFGAFKVVDRQYDKYNFLIHDYFIARSIDLVRPGGVVTVVTSSGTMDKQSDAMRQYVAARADLLGAIRLPKNTFLRNANTGVVTDILFFQKRESAAIEQPDLPCDFTSSFLHVIFFATTTMRPFLCEYSQVESVSSLSPYRAVTPVSYSARSRQALM